MNNAAFAPVFMRVGGYLHADDFVANKGIAVFLDQGVKFTMDSLKDGSKDKMASTTAETIS